VIIADGSGTDAQAGWASWNQGTPVEVVVHAGGGTDAY
jgi:hypothetical protein